MAEYTYDNILINPSKEGIESLIGKEVYFEAKPFLCLKAANEKLASSSGILVEVYEDSINPFYVKSKSGSYRYPCIIVKKEEPKPVCMMFENREEFFNYYYYTTIAVQFKHLLTTFGGVWIKEGIFGAYCMVTKIYNDGVLLGSEENMIAWDELYKKYTFLDGTPCGKEVK